MDWAEEELGGINLGDKRLNVRAKTTAMQLISLYCIEVNQNYRLPLNLNIINILNNYSLNTSNKDF